MTTANQKDYLLSPYRVLDLTGEHGLMCGKVLGDFGAEVIIVEPPGGHPARSIGPFYKDAQHPEKSLFWFAFNTSKKSVTLDITRSEGRRLLKELVREMCEADLAEAKRDALVSSHGYKAPVRSE